MGASFNLDTVQELASEYEYTQCQHDAKQGLAAFRRADTRDGTPEIVRVWYGTRTVETQLKHPNRAARTALFRRNVPHYRALREIFDNPRTHTGTGYYRNPEKDTACPGCSKRFRGAVGCVCHYENGHCRSNPDASAARRMAYDIAKGAGADFLTKRISYYAYSSSDDSDYDTYDAYESDGYDSDGANYICNACEREFITLTSLMQHQRARAQCQHLVTRHSLMIGA